MEATFVHRAEYGLLRLVERVLSARSWETRQSWGARLGRVWYRLDNGHRRIARENALRAFPDWGPERIDRLVRANFEHLGITAAEFLGSSRVSAEEAMARTRIEGGEHLEKALAGGRGALFLVGHLGNWEFGGLSLAARGVPFYAIGKRLSNPVVDREVTAIRERLGGHLIPHRNAVRPVIKALRGGGTVAVLLDQKPLRREAVPSRFFGLPVATNSGLAILALKTGAPVIPGFDRREDGAHVVRFGPEIAPPSEGTLEERVRAFTAAFDATIEAAVRACPEQWFWVHRRWRLPEGWA